MLLDELDQAIEVPQKAGQLDAGSGQILDSIVTGVVSDPNHHHFGRGSPG